jgi:hypothetical protein
MVAPQAVLWNKISVKFAEKGMDLPPMNRKTCGCRLKAVAVGKGSKFFPDKLQTKRNVILL